MKKVIYSIIITLLFIPVLVCASTFSNAESLTKRYIKHFLYPERYIKVDNGDFISHEEVEKAMVRKDSDGRLLTVSSYMYDGTKFWAKDRYVIAEKIEQRPQNENYKTKVTELVLHDTKVKGTGKYTDPWIFVDSFKVTVRVGSGEGTIDGLLESTKSVDANGVVAFGIAPQSGYKYLNNTCGENLTGSMLEIRNVEKDMVCVVNFETSRYSESLPKPYSKTVHIALTNRDVTYDFDWPEPRSFSSRYGDGYYTDDTLKTRLGKLTTLPKRDGWTFKGYYVKRKNPNRPNYIEPEDEILITEKGFFEQTYKLLKDNNTSEVIGWDAVPNKYNITFDKNGGTGGTNELLNQAYEHDLPAITVPGRPGYVFEGYYSTNADGSYKDKYYNASGSEVKIFEMAKAGNLTLKARWEECGSAKYCPGDNVRHECPNGYKNTATTTSTKCSDCRYWDPCHTGHNTCRYGCGTCCSSYSYACGTSYSCAHSGSLGGMGGCTELRRETIYCSGQTCSSCNCSSCYYGENTCKGDWVYNTSCSEGTVYTVNLNKNNGEGGDNSYTVTYYGNSAKVNVDSIATPHREGYVFEGYYTSTSGGTKIVDVTNTTSGFVAEPNIKAYQTPSGTTFTLYAHWIKCSKGSYCPGNNVSDLCLEGQYQDEEGKTNCKDCTPGTYTGEKGSITCKSCPAGTYQDEPGKDSCKNCVAGTYQNEEGKTSCKNCVKASFSDEGLNRCMPCYGGKTSNEKSSNCQLTCSNSANVNKWEDTIWNDDNTVTNECKIKTCNSGYYLNGSACTKCPAGYENSDSGSTAITACYMNVAAGKYVKTAKDSSPTKCPKGYYGGAHTVYYNSTSSCTKCSSGKTTAGTGSTSSSACENTKKCYRPEYATVEKTVDGVKYACEDDTCPTNGACEGCGSNYLIGACDGEYEGHVNVGGTTHYYCNRIWATCVKYSGKVHPCIKNFGEIYYAASSESCPAYYCTSSPCKHGPTG